MSTDYVVWSASTKKKGFKKTEYKWAMNDSTSCD